MTMAFDGLEFCSHPRRGWLSSQFTIIMMYDFILISCLVPSTRDGMFDRLAPVRLVSG